MRAAIPGPIRDAPSAARARQAPAASSFQRLEKYLLLDRRRESNRWFQQFLDRLWREAEAIPTEAGLALESPWAFRRTREFRCRLTRGLWNKWRGVFCRRCR